MREAEGNLWEMTCDLRVITTNGQVNRRGEAVMGRGCAREAKGKVPGIEDRFGRMLKKHGNRVMRLAKLPGGSHLASFPVKHHWREEADLQIIRRSAGQLARLVDKFGYQKVVMPRPGCGNGRLEWADVRPLLETALDDRFTVVTFPSSR